MKLFHVIVAIKIFEVYSASEISLLNDDEPLTAAAASIVDKCFASSERWSEVEVIVKNASTKMVEKIQLESKTTISMVSLNTLERNELIHPEECNDHLDASVQWQETKPTAVIINIRSLKELESILSSLKTDVKRIWRPESYFLIVLEAGCNLEECNEMLKMIWDHWILNAAILCSSTNHREIELYTFNPFSTDHSPQWEIIVQEKIEVSIAPGNFNHSWYIFKRKFTKIKPFENCDDLFFDKTLNLDGYTIPISFVDLKFLSDDTESLLVAAFAVDAPTLRLIAKKLQFGFAQVFNRGTKDYGKQLENGSYVGILKDLCSGRSHIAPNKRGVRPYPGLEMTYPHDVSGACFGSWIVGNRPQWTNLADAKSIWIALGLGVICFTLVLYLQNKSRGIVAAFLDAERLIIGSSIIRTSTIIKHRIILGSIFLTVLVLDGAFRSRFISILTIARPYPNLDTLEQIKEQNIRVCGHLQMKNMITDPEIEKRFENFEFPICLNNQQSRKSQRACFADCDYLRFSTVNSSDIHIAPTPIWTSYVTFLTTMHWPLKNRYSFETQKLVESGILEKWKTDKIRELEVDAWKLRRAAESPFVRPLKLNDLLPAFVLLFLGLLAALVIFLWELRGSKPPPSLSYASRK